MPMRPLRRRQPYIGAPPPAAVAAPVSRPRAPLIVALAAAAGGVPPRVPPPLITRVPGRTVRQQAPQLALRVFRRDERAFAGRFLQTPPHRPTLRLTPEQLALTIIRRDERGFAGRFFQTPPHRPTLRLTPEQLTLTVARRDERGFSGRFLQTPPHRPTLRLSAEQLAPTLIRRDERSFAGQRLGVRPPFPTVRQGAGQLQSHLYRQDERRFAGRFLRSPVPPPATAPAPPAAPPRLALVRRAEPPRRGQFWLSRLPARTVRLISPQLDWSVVRPLPVPIGGRWLVVRPPVAPVAAPAPKPHQRLQVFRADRPQFSGAFLVSHVPASTVRQIVPLLAPRLIRGPDRRFAGRVWLLPLPHAAATAPATRPLRFVLVRREERPPGGRLLLFRPAPFRTVRLLAPQLSVRLIFRQYPRPAGTPGRVLFVVPPRPRIIPRLPQSLLIRRDERGYRGFCLRLPASRANATVVTHGNPRAAVTLRARPGATVAVRSRPTAGLTLRRPSAKIEFKEG